MIHIVLVSPEIPQNTGNIARTCAATGCALHLVKPLGFSIDDKHLKRAGLDYWDKVTVGVYESFEELEQKYPDAHFYPVETEGSRFHTEVTYPEDVFFVFGKETKVFLPPLPLRPGRCRHARHQWLHDTAGRPPAAETPLRMQRHFPALVKKPAMLLARETPKKQMQAHRNRV